MESGRALGCTTAVMYLGTRSEENTHIMVALSLVLFIDISGKSITFPRQTYTFDLIWPDFGEYYFSNSLLLYFSEGHKKNPNMAWYQIPCTSYVKETKKSRYGMMSGTRCISYVIPWVGFCSVCCTLFKFQRRHEEQGQWATTPRRAPSAPLLDSSTHTDFST